MSLRNLEAVTKAFPITRLQSTLMLIDSGSNALCACVPTAQFYIYEDHWCYGLVSYSFIHTDKSKSQKNKTEKDIIFAMALCLHCLISSVSKWKKDIIWDLFSLLIYPQGQDINVENAAGEMMLMFAELWCWRGNSGELNYHRKSQPDPILNEFFFSTNWERK